MVPRTMRAILVGVRTNELLQPRWDAVRTARAESDSLRGLILVSDKSNQWVAGADLKIVTRPTDAKQAEAVVRRFQAVLEELAWLPCTTVAAINGAEVFTIGASWPAARQHHWRALVIARAIEKKRPKQDLDGEHR